jgi:hypothetical protein
MADVTAITGWCLGKTAAAAIAVAIVEKTAKCGMFNLIVLKVFDNTAFYARTCEGRGADSLPERACKRYLPHR